jgi:hypothetical protein
VYDTRAVAAPESLATTSAPQVQEALVPAAPQHRHVHPGLYVTALGILSFFVFWPLCFVGLALAWRAMRQIGCDRTHPQHGVVRAAVILNTVAAVIGIVFTTVGLVVLGLEWAALSRQHHYRFIQIAVDETSKRIALR